MTPQEQLFAEYYNNEKSVVVANMDDNQLREHREELRKIAFEARARLQAASDASDERERKRSKKFSDQVTSVASDDVTSNTLQNVKTRATRMSKLERAKQNMLDMGMDPDDVEKMFTAAAQLEVRENRIEKKLNLSLNLSKKEESKPAETATEEKPKIESQPVIEVKPEVTEPKPKLNFSISFPVKG